MLIDGSRFLGGGESPQAEDGFNEEKPYGEPVRSDEELKQMALRVVKEDIEAGKKANESMAGERATLYELYRAKNTVSDDLRDTTRKGRSRVISSDVMDSIEWMMPNFMKAFAGGRDCIDVTPQGTEDIEKAEKNKRLLNWQFKNRCNGFQALYTLIKSGLVYGTSYAKITWREDYVRKGFHLPEVIEPQMQALMQDDSIEEITVGSVDYAYLPMTGGMNGMVDPNAMGYGWPPQQLEPVRVYRDVSGERRIVTYSGPRVDVIPPEEILIDPDAKSMDDAMFVIHRVKRTVSYLREKEKEGVYSGISEVVRYTSSDESLRLSEDSERQALAGDSFSFSSSGESEQVARRKVEVFEWWGLLDAKGDGVAEPYLVVLAGDTIIRMERNPYAHGLPPFVELRPILDLFRFHGIGMAELVGEFQQVKTALMRQTLDNLSFQNNQMWEVDENAGVDVQSLINPRPGGVVFTNFLGKGFREITPQPLGSAPLQMMEFIQTQLEQRSGVTRYNQGLDAKSLNKTATGISVIMNASAQRIELIARIMSDSIRRMYKMMLELNQQFIDQKLVVRIFNEPMEISPDDLAGNFDVVVDISGATGKEEEEVNQMVQLLQYSTTLMQIGVMTPQNVYEGVRKIMDLWGWKDYEKYIEDPQTQQQLQMAMQQIAQLGQMVQAGQIPDMGQVIGVLQSTFQILAQATGMGGAMNGNQGQPPSGGGEGEHRGPAVTGLLDPNGRAVQGSGPVPIEAGYGGTPQGRGVFPERAT